jgi:hypothetical protein
MRRIGRHDRPGLAGAHLAPLIRIGPQALIAHVMTETFARAFACVLVALAALAPASPARAAFQVEVADSATLLPDLDAALALLAAGADFATVVELINFTDLGNLDGRYKPSGGFANLPFPGGRVDQFALRATAVLTIPVTGIWTFGLDHDNGARLLIDGINISADPLRVDGRTRLMRVDLDAGEHALELVYYENRGGATLELFAAPGKPRRFDRTLFDLIGDTANGGLVVQVAAVGLPPSLVLLLPVVGGLMLRRHTTR